MVQNTPPPPPHLGRRERVAGACLCEKPGSCRTGPTQSECDPATTGAANTQMPCHVAATIRPGANDETTTPVGAIAARLPLAGISGIHQKLRLRHRQRAPPSRGAVSAQIGHAL